MNRLCRLVCVGISTAMLLMLGVASAHSDSLPDSPSEPSESHSGSGGGRARDLSVGNDADLDAQGDDAKASANCQFLMAVNTVILNLVVAESLGLTDGVVLGSSSGSSPGSSSGSNGRRGHDDDHNETEDERTSTATCEQDFGTIRIVNNPSIGWGEVAPHGRALDEVFKAIRNGRNATGTSGGAGATVAGGSHALVNRVSMDLRGNGTHALASCQFVVAANTFVLDATFASATGQTSGDSGSSHSGSHSGSHGGGHNGTRNETAIERTATSSCTQRIDSFELLLGERTVLVPES